MGIMVDSFLGVMPDLYHQLQLPRRKAVSPACPTRATSQRLQYPSIKEICPEV